MSVNKQMENLEMKSFKTNRALQDILYKLSHIPNEMHGLSSRQIKKIEDVINILSDLEYNLYFNNEDRIERF